MISFWIEMNSNPAHFSVDILYSSWAIMTLRTALTILTYVPANSKPGLRRRLPAALASLQKSGYTGPIFVVDDGSTDAQHLAFLTNLDSRISVVLRKHNGGISRAKNTCLRLLSESDCEIGFIAEDDAEFCSGWFGAYCRAHAATGIHHFSWAWDDDPSGGMKKMIRDACGFAFVETTLVNGVFLSLTPDVINKVGGFKILPAFWGHEHTNWTRRIIKAGLAPFFADVADSNDYVGLNVHSVDSSIHADDRPRFAELNADPAEDLEPVFLPLIE